MSICATIERGPKCVKHSRPLTRSLDTSEEKAPMKATRCSIDGCKRGGQMRRGMCEMHYNQLRRLGKLVPLPTVEDRLAAGLVRMPNGCLEWTRGTNDKGYGMIWVDGKMIYTHRLAWGLAHPDEPPPPVVRHFECDNPPCCDETHLRPGTQRQNVADMSTKGRGRNQNNQKTHCKNGHPFDEANTYTWRGRRQCRECHRACHRAAEAARRAKAHS